MPCPQTATLGQDTKDIQNKPFSVQIKKWEHISGCEECKRELERLGRVDMANLVEEAKILYPQ